MAGWATSPPFLKGEPVNRADAEFVLTNRTGGKMTAAGLDGATTNGANADLNDALATALLGMGVTPANIASVSDADLSAVTDINQFLDRAELRVLETIAGNLDMVDITVGPRREALSQLAEQVQKAVERLTRRLETLYGVGIGSLSASTIGLDFAEHNEVSEDA